MKNIIKIILLLFIFNVYSQDKLKWNFKYSGYADSKIIKLPRGGQIINLFNNQNLYHENKTNKTKS